MITLNQFIKYIHKGPDFGVYPYYSAIVGHNKIRKKQGISKSKRGRQASLIYGYDGKKNSGCPDDSFGQSVGQKFCIPIIPGPAPPAYPGKQPIAPWNEPIDIQIAKEQFEVDRVEFYEKLAQWNKKAKVFVEFYSLLFLPWDEKFDPRDPANPELQVLPWNETTSSANFTKIFRSFDVDTQGTNDHREWFRRSTYKLFTNMSHNLVQSYRARKIMLACKGSGF